MRNQFVSTLQYVHDDAESCGLSARSDGSARLETSLQGDCRSPGSEPVVYRHDPYCDSGRVTYGPPSPQAEPFDWSYPEGTLHWSLAGLVTFVPYPQEEFLSAPPPPLNGPLDLPRLFIGQLPYAVTDMQLDWLCVTLAGASVYYPERIVKRDDNRGGSKMPTGCVHAYCDPHTVDALVEMLHKRVLFDDTGVWFAANAAEMDVLAQYCQTMKDDKRRRFQHRPYDSVVVQRATSTYVPAAFFGPRHR